jgi:hypothetical protein
MSTSPSRSIVPTLSRAISGSGRSISNRLITGGVQPGDTFGIAKQWRKFDVNIIACQRWDIDRHGFEAFCRNYQGNVEVTRRDY